MTADKSYQMTPIGNDVARYPRTKRMRLTDSSYRSYEFCLEKFVRHCEDMQPEDFEPPAGMQRLAAPSDPQQQPGLPARQHCLRLLLDYGLRKGALQTIQFTHFDHQRQRLTIFTKGEKVRQIPIPQATYWTGTGVVPVSWPVGGFSG